MLLKLVRTSTLIYLLHFIFSWELCPSDCPSDDQWHDDCCADSHNETSHVLMKTHDWFMDLRSPLFLSIFYYRGELRSFCVQSCDSKLQAKVSNQIICIPSVCSRRHQQRQRAEEQALTTCTISRHECWTEKLHMEFWAHLLYNSKKTWQGNRPNIWTSSREISLSKTEKTLAAVSSKGEILIFDVGHAPSSGLVAKSSRCVCVSPPSL